MTLTIPRRFTGPPDSGNGGYVAGRVAETLLAALDLPAVGESSPWVEVTLRTPPPLDTPYAAAVDGPAVAVRSTADDALVAEARVLEDTQDPVDEAGWVPTAVAAEAEGRYAGVTTHPFPTCWVCGHGRPDGYHLRPGLVGDAGEHPRTACRWTVTDDAVAGLDEGDRLETRRPGVPAAAVWAALDCPGGWTALAGGRVAVLGRMSARVAATPVVGDECVVTGRLLGSEGRKAWTSTSVYSSDGAELARAAGTWIALPTS